MSHSNINLRETLIRHDAPQRGATSVKCPVLGSLGIAQVGSSEIRGGYEVVRLDPSVEHLTVCSVGHGFSLQEGAWVPFLAGSVALSPAHAPHGAKSASIEDPWVIHWVGFDGTRKWLNHPHALLKAGRVSSLARAIDGLLDELESAAEEPLTTAWAELVALSARRLCSAATIDPRLLRVWSEVSAELAKEWTLPALARVAGVSEGHLRRLCYDAFGCSPQAKLRELRLDRAAALLLSNDDKVEAIASAVGFTNPFAFSTAFRRATGVPPRQFRRDRG